MRARKRYKAHTAHAHLLLEKTYADGHVYFFTTTTTTATTTFYYINCLLPFKTKTLPLPLLLLASMHERSNGRMV